MSVARLDAPVCQTCGTPYETERERACREFEAVKLLQRALGKALRVREGQMLTPALIEERAANICLALWGEFRFEVRELRPNEPVDFNDERIKP